MVVEGESESQTLWFYAEPAAGIPGANSWKAGWADDLKGIDKIYVVEADEGGEALWRKLVATPEIRERLYRVDAEGAKDVSDLHKQGPESFRERLRKARESARAWHDIAETEEEERSREAWASCQELAKSEDILAEFIADLERCRLVGERTNATLLFLAMVTHLLPRIVSVAVKGPSSGGKSYLVKLVPSFFPESASVRLTSFSEKTLFHTEEPLTHRHIILSEASGLGDFQEYVIRKLLSEGFLDYEFVERTPEGVRPRRIRMDQPASSPPRRGISSMWRTRRVTSPSRSPTPGSRRAGCSGPWRRSMSRSRTASVGTHDRFGWRAPSAASLSPTRGRLPRRWV